MSVLLSFLIPVDSLHFEYHEGKVVISWKRVDTSASRYELYRRIEGGTPELLGSTSDTFLVDTSAKQGLTYEYMVRSYMDTLFTDGVWIAFTIPLPQTKENLPWFNTKRLPVLIFLILFSMLFFYYFFKASRGERIYIRRISGLDAIDEAVGRSTEMGRPVMFVHGLAPLDFPPTIAAIAILKYIAKKVAMYDIDIIVPNNDPLVMLASREAVREGCLEAGRPDVYKEENIMFLTTQQFGYAAGVNGLIVRLKPGATFFQGYFYAESLIMAETAYSAGSISIAGTTAITQLPFFIAACDYTLIGEELFAASAYLSQNPVEIGTIKAEDIAKIAIIGIIIVGIVLATFNLPIYETYKSIFSVGG